MQDLLRVVRRLRDRAAQLGGRETLDSVGAPAEALKRRLLDEYAGTSLDEAFPGEVVANAHGSCYRVFVRVPVAVSLFGAEEAQAAILSELKLIYGVGPVTEARLKDQGTRTIGDLVSHPRFGLDAEALLDLLARRDLRRVQAWVARWLLASHPAALRLAGLVERERFVLFDLESLGLFDRPVILLGFARLVDGALEVQQYIVRSVAEELAALTEALQGMSDAALVTYNGKSFDLAYLRQRLAYYGQDAHLDPLHFDLLPHARGRFRGHVPDCRLETLERCALGMARGPDVPSALIPDFYETYLREKNIGPLAAIIQHNRSDLLALAALLSALCRR